MKWRHLDLIVPLTVDHANEGNNRTLLSIFALKPSLNSTPEISKPFFCLSRIVARLKEIFLSQFRVIEIFTV